MKIIIILTAIFCLGFIVAARIFYEREDGRSALSNILAATSLCLYISHIILKVVIDFGYFTFPWFILLFAGCLYVMFVNDYDYYCMPAIIVAVIAGIGYLFAGWFFIDDAIEAGKQEDIVTTESIYISGDESISGEMIDGDLYVYIQTTEDSKHTIIVKLTDAESLDEVQIEEITHTIE